MIHEKDIANLYEILQRTGFNHDKCVSQIKQKLCSSPKLAKGVSSQLKNELDKQNIDCTIIKKVIICSSYVSQFQQFQQLFENFKRDQINNLGKYIMQEKDILGLKSAIKFVEKIFLQRSLIIFSTSQMLFRALIQRFIDLKEDDDRELLTEILVEMLLDNSKLIPIANNPYYFLEYWLHLINQQNQLDRKLYWVQAVNKLYSRTKSEKFLFFQSDFRAFIDILLNVISICPTSQDLRIPLSCYLVLSCCESMKKPYKIQILRQQLCGLNTKQLQIEDLVSQINSL